MSKLLICCLSIVLLLPANLFAWGREGHAIVAQIAESRLTPKAREGVEALLAKRSTMSSVASWADTIRKDRGETAPWHYVNIPYEMRGYDAARDGKNGQNIIDKIVDFANVLDDRQRPDADREEALKFLIHFVGDIHQPLHCADRNDDKGGNFRLVFFLDDPKALSLHRTWDSEILEHMMKGGEEDESIKAMAARIAVGISEKQVREWTKGDPVAWANESHKLAVQVAYADLPADGPPPKLDLDYVARAQPVVEQQLARAGVRLADVLNRIFR
jgi:hypothetical protein